MRKKVIKLRGAKVNSTFIGEGQSPFFVVGDSQNKVRLLNFESDQIIETFTINNNLNINAQITAVAINDNNTQIFSGSSRGPIHIWDIQANKINNSLKGHPLQVSCFGYFAEQPFTLASGGINDIKMWDLRERNCTNIIKGHTKIIKYIEISPNGECMLSASQDQTARLWDFRNTQKPVFVANQHNGPVLQAKFSQTDCVFATCSNDRTAKFYQCDIDENKLKFQSSTELVSTPITSICFSLEGKNYLFTASNDMLKCWNVLKGGMQKVAQLIESYETSWKNVKQLKIINDTLMGISNSGGNLGLWLCDVNGLIKNKSRMIQKQSFVLPKIQKNYNKQQAEQRFNQMQSQVQKALSKVNNIKENSPKDISRQKQKKRQEQQQKRQLIEQRKKQYERKRREQQKLRREAEQKQRQQKKQRQKQQQKRRQQIQNQRIEQQKRLMQQKLYNQRLARDRQMKQVLKQTFQLNNRNQQNSIIQNSSLINMSMLDMDAGQKQQMRQFQLIGQIMTGNMKTKYQLNERISKIKPIINFWKQGRINLALQLLQKSSQDVFIDCTSTFLTAPIFKQAITPDVGRSLTEILRQNMKNYKKSSQVIAVMTNINIIVELFKQQLIKIKTFNTLSRVDITRQQRLAKYDRLLTQFLSVFKQPRLKKYASRKQSSQQEIVCAAYNLYKNLEEVLIKIMPKQQPEQA